MTARILAVLLASSLAVFGCKKRTEPTELKPVEKTETVDEHEDELDDKSAGSEDEESEEGWTPRPIGGGPAPTVEPTPTPAPKPKATPKKTTPAPAPSPSTTPSTTPSGWAWPQSVPTWPWGAPDAGPQKPAPAPSTTTPAPAPAPSTNPSSTTPAIPWPWATQQ